MSPRDAASRSLDLSLYDYTLPESAIALHPAAERDDSRLMGVTRGGGVTGHHRFRDLVRLLRSGDLLVLNETLAIPARLWGRKEGTGGRVEILLVKPEKPGTWEVLWRPHRRVHVGLRVEILAKSGGANGGDAQANPRGAAPRVPSGILAEVTGISPDGRLLARFEGAPGTDLARRLDELGEPPLPPYIRREAEPEDRERYQTVFARVRGSVAAPTAGLHFTDRLLGELEAHGVGTARVVLHVGLATFQPVSEADLAAGELGEEYFEVPAETARKVNETRAAGGRVVAVGTTVVRALETAWSSEDAEGGAAARGRLTARRGWTRAFIYPPYRFQLVDALITNFHLPRSTLILLAAAFAGRETLLGAYREALAAGYRFASYGDAMLIE